MNKGERTIGRQPDGAQIRAALNRIVDSPALRKSPQLAHFLSFVVDETLAGRGQRLKAYSIATDALGRDADFDPQNDPIVRVEAGRLRHSLTHYYANGGSNDPIVIELPRGHYVPAFRANPARRRLIARLRSLQRQTADALRENYRLLLMMAVVAASVSLTVEALERTIWPHAEYAKPTSPPAISAAASTGSATR